MYSGFFTVGLSCIEIRNTVKQLKMKISRTCSNRLEAKSLLHLLLILSLSR